VADVVNYDPVVGGLLKVIFIPDYKVSDAQVIIPAADLSEQISTAGMEASGTGNMKLTLNGALTIGTLDGANIEIRERVGEENFFLFGHTTEEVLELRQQGYGPALYYQENDSLRAVLDAIAHGFFSQGDHGRYQGLVDSLLHGDYFMVLADYQSYLDQQNRVDALYQQPQNWYYQVIKNIMGVGYFSSDRAIHQYAEEIWGVKPV